ncbi:MAG: hypothetical protein ABW321_00430, partial [Polyangiales bacterium]
MNAPSATSSSTTSPATAHAEHAATFLLSAAMLGIQIGWTRIFSFMIWYHFAFLVISTAMLGFTVGGLLLQLRPRWLVRDDADDGVLLWPSALAFCVSTLVTLTIVCNLPFRGGVLDSLRDFALFCLLVLLMAASFAAAGTFVAVVIARRPAQVARSYAANMLGSGVGCGLAVPLLDRLVPVSAVLAFGLIAWSAQLPLLPSVPRRRRAVIACAL